LRVCASFRYQTLTPRNCHREGTHLDLWTIFEVSQLVEDLRDNNCQQPLLTFAPKSILIITASFTRISDSITSRQTIFTSGKNECSRKQNGKPVKEFSYFYVQRTFQCFRADTERAVLGSNDWISEKLGSRTSEAKPRKEVSCPGHILDLGLGLGNDFNPTRKTNWLVHQVLNRMAPAAKS
jgi:hypothetical protein